MFFRGKDELQRTKTGTGLGLYIVRTLIGILKGRIIVSDSDTGTGTVFEVTLPGRILALSAADPVPPDVSLQSRVSVLALAARDTAGMQNSAPAIDPPQHYDSGVSDMQFGAENSAASNGEPTGLR